VCQEKRSYLLIKTKMEKEEAKKIIRETITNMGGENIDFPESDDKNSMVVLFNCKEITSFVANIQGWTYSGIQLDLTNGHQYKIEFKKSL